MVVGVVHLAARAAQAPEVGAVRVGAVRAAAVIALSLDWLIGLLVTRSMAVRVVVKDSGV